MSLMQAAFTKALATIRSCVANTRLEPYAVVRADARHRVPIGRYSKHERFAVIDGGGGLLLLVPVKVERVSVDG